VQKNQVTVGRVVGGATVEHEARGRSSLYGPGPHVAQDPTNSTAGAIARVVNAWLPGKALAARRRDGPGEVPQHFRAFRRCFS